MAACDTLFIEFASRERLSVATFDAKVLTAFPEIANVRAIFSRRVRSRTRVFQDQAPCKARATASRFPEVQASTSDFPLFVKVTQ